MDYVRVALSYPCLRLLRMRFNCTHHLDRHFLLFPYPTVLSGSVRIVLWWTSPLCGLDFLCFMSFHISSIIYLFYPVFRFAHRLLLNTYVILTVQYVYYRFKYLVITLLTCIPIFTRRFPHSFNVGSVHVRIVCGLKELINSCHK